MEEAPFPHPIVCVRAPGLAFSVKWRRLKLRRMLNFSFAPVKASKIRVASEYCEQLYFLYGTERSYSEVRYHAVADKNCVFVNPLNRPLNSNIQSLHLPSTMMPRTVKRVKIIRVTDDDTFASISICCSILFAHSVSIVKVGRAVGCVDGSE